MLIARANEHGGEDNITAVLIKIEDHGDATTEEIPAAREKPIRGGDEELGMSEEPTSPGLHPSSPPQQRSKPSPS